MSKKHVCTPKTGWENARRCFGKLGQCGKPAQIYDFNSGQYFCADCMDEINRRYHEQYPNSQGEVTEECL